MQQILTVGAPHYHNKNQYRHCRPPLVPMNSLQESLDPKMLPIKLPYNRRHHKKKKRQYTKLISCKVRKES